MFIMSVILINMVTMMMEHNNQTESFTAALNILLTSNTGLNVYCKAGTISGVDQILSPLVRRVSSIKQRKTRKGGLKHDITLVGRLLLAFCSASGHRFTTCFFSKILSKETAGSLNYIKETPVAKENCCSNCVGSDLIMI